MPQQRASQSQISYLRDLARSHAIWGSELTRTETLAKVEEIIASDLSSDEASNLIATAIRAARHPADQVPATEWQIRRSRDIAAEYAIFGLSYKVEETIAKVEAAINGPFFSSADAYALLDLARKAAPHPTAQTPLRLSDIEGIDGLNISEGHYAVFDGDDVLRFYRIYSPTTGANKDVPVIRRYAGDMLKGLYPDEARTVLHAIDADPDTAAYRYSDTFTRCFVCGKNLTDSVSRLLSVGPTCRGFANHSGLRRAGSEVDHDPARRVVYRALRDWALGRGFTDPRNKEERQHKSMTASRLASAWSGLPGILGLDPTEAVAMVDAALVGGKVSDALRSGLLGGNKDTLLILVDSGILTAAVMEILVQHPDTDVAAAANDFFLAQLGM